VLGRVGDEEPADQPGEGGAVPGRQAAEHRRDVRAEQRGGRRHQRPALVGEPDEHGPPVGGGGCALDQAPALGAVDQAGDARLVEVKEACELVHGRLAVPQHAEQARRRDRQVVLGGAPLKQARDHEGELRQPVDGVELTRRGRGIRSGRHGAIVLDLVRDTN
jgi:hypothetical protein